MVTNNSPLVSVIVPVYNVECMLDKCVESIISQSYKNLEILLVDDGSPDNCPAKCDLWAKDDERIRVIHKKNGGLSSARNAGLAEAQGKFVSFIDSDDYIDVDMIDRMVTEALQNDSQMVVCGTVNELYDNGKYSVLGCAVMQDMRTSNNGQVKKIMLELTDTGYCIPVWNKLFRYDFLKQYDASFDESLHLGEDSVFEAHLYKYVDRLSCISKAFYHYVSRDNSLCSKFKPDWFSQRCEIFLKIKSELGTWSEEAIGLFARGLVRQSGFILSALYEDSEVTGESRDAILHTIVESEILDDALHCIIPQTKRDKILIFLLRKHSIFLMKVYGWTIALIKSMRNKILS